MGPTNVALVKLFQADQQLRAAQERLDAATKNVRIQERRTNDLAEKIRQAQAALKEQQSHAATMSDAPTLTEDAVSPFPAYFFAGGPGAGLALGWFLSRRKPSRRSMRRETASVVPAEPSLETETPATMQARRLARLKSVRMT